MRSRMSLAGRARRIRLLVLDVDGVLTDGQLLYGRDGESLKGFDIHDGLALVAWKQSGFLLAVLSGRRSSASARRLAELGLEEVYQGLAKKLPKYPVVPATLLGRLAVDVRLRGKGAGEHLLMDALRRALEAAREVASLAVVVDAKDDAAVSFYRHYDFISFADRPRRLFLPMAVIEKLFG